jgi:2'-5' RNA ligase
VRLFIGIPLSSETLHALDRLSQSLRSPGDGLRWTSPDTWHITLQFLGETTVDTYECAVAKLSEIQFTSVPVWLRGTGLFDRAGVFFADVSVSPELRILQKQILAATSQCGIVPENRPYHPHITLARAKSGDRGRTLRNLKASAASDAQFPAFIAREFLLYESFLGPSGARHEIRNRFSLG